MTDIKCEVCGKPYVVFMYPRIGPAPGFWKVPDCDCVTEFDKEKKKVMESYKKWKESEFKEA